MIEIKKENTFKVLKPEEFQEGEMLLGKYKLWKNEAMTPARICYSRSFGGQQAINACAENTTWLGFNTKTKELEVTCSSYGGMAGFTFNENDINGSTASEKDKQCMKFTINILKWLAREGIIEIEGFDPATSTKNVSLQHLICFADKLGYKYEINDPDITLRKRDVAGVNEIKILGARTGDIIVHMDIYGKRDTELLGMAVDYANVDINNRDNEIRYIIPLPYLKTPEEEKQYLTHKNSNFYASKRDVNLRQTWKKKDLVYIPKEYVDFAVILDEQEE